MKKIFNIILLLLILIGCSITVKAMTFEEGLKESYNKPMIMIVYAQWADDYNTYLTNFRSLQDEYDDKLNFVELDIASPDTKAFNDKFHIYPNLPYVLMYKNGGTISRYIQRSCVKDTSCMIQKINMFVH